MVSKYAGADGVVQRAEAIQAVLDYLGGKISKQDATDVLNACSGCLLVTSVVSKYAGADGIVQGSEALQAVLDYRAGKISKQDAIDVVLACKCVPNLA